MTADDHIGTRAISEESKRAWVAQCEKEQKEGKSSPPVCLWGNAFLRHVRYIPFSEFYDALVTSWQGFAAHIGDRPFAILLDPRKYGSEHWLLQMLWSSGIPKVADAEIITELNPTSDPTDIVILDDVLYTGMHVFGVLDEAFHNATQGGKRMLPPGRYRFHFVVPYVTKQARAFIEESLPHLSPGNTATFYPVSPVLTLLEYEPSLKDTAYDTDERKQYSPKPGVIEAFDLNPQGMDFTPLYLDFKIAKNASTATSLLERMVTPLPSRRALKEAEACYMQ
jgi:hypothetical protein